MNAILSFIGTCFFLVVCICLFMASVTPDFAEDVGAPPQSVFFDSNTCNDIRKRPVTETQYGAVSNGYYCGHE